MESTVTAYGIAYVLAIPMSPVTKQNVCILL